MTNTYPEDYPERIKCWLLESDKYTSLFLEKEFRVIKKDYSEHLPVILAGFEKLIHDDKNIAGRYQMANADNLNTAIKKHIDTSFPNKPVEEKAILFNQELTANELACQEIRQNLIKKIKQYLLKPLSHSDMVEIIQRDAEKRLSHLPPAEKKKQILEAVSKYETECEKKRKARANKKQRMTKNQKDSKTKTTEEMVAGFTANLERQLAHKTPEERVKKIEEEVKKYKDSLLRRNKTIDQLVEDEKADISKTITEFIEKKYPDKTEAEKKKMFDEHFEKNVKLCKEGFEDTKVFNKRMDEKRREFEEIKYSNTVEGLDKMRKRLVDLCIHQRKKFLGILDEETPEQNNDTMRTFEPGKGPRVNVIPNEEPDSDDEKVTLEPNDIRPIDVASVATDATVNTTETKAPAAASEHNRTEYISHESLAKSNFKDLEYYYKARKFYRENPEHLEPYVNMLFWASKIDVMEVTEADKKAIDEEDVKLEEARQEQKAKRRAAKELARKTREEIMEIDEQLKLLAGELNESKITEVEYIERSKPLMERRDILEPPAKTPEEQLQEYALEMREKYSKIEHVRVERAGIINMELQDYAKILKREIGRDRKLTNERAEKTAELTEQYKKQYGRRALNLQSHVEKEVDEYMQVRARELNEFFIQHGVDPREHDNVSINNAKIMHADYLKQSTTEVWKSMEAEMKQEYFKAKYPQFFDAFPIVVKFMIQQGKFEIVAFKRFLEKCRTNVAVGSNPYANNMPKRGTKRLTPNEEKWLENQAWYVQYLTEEYRQRVGQRLTTHEANWIRNKQLEALRAEMMDFRSNFEKVAEKLKDTHNENDEKLLLKYLEQVKNGETELTPEEQENIAFAVEQVVKKREELKAKVAEAMKASEKELVDVDEVAGAGADEVNDDTPKVEKPAPPAPPAPAPPKQKTESELRAEQREQFVKLNKKSRKRALSKEEQAEHARLKSVIMKEDKKIEDAKEFANNLAKATGGCTCLKHQCDKCTGALTKTEESQYKAKVGEIKSKHPKNWNIYEAFIMKSPSKDTVLVEYAGGYLEPVSVRQFIKDGTFTINGDKLELINKNKKYGGFHPRT
jgi:hypothetical protein